MKIYLCSRIAKDAHDLNNQVAQALRQLGHEVFVPHEQHYNEIMGGKAEQVDEAEIYTQDMEAMEASDICVAVGRIGVDCAFELGWFEGSNVPIFWYRPEGLEYGRHPMLYAIPTYTEIGADSDRWCSLIDAVRRHHSIWLMTSTNEGVSDAGA
jgi:nucleoside 2-deoxyribosyltransferase